MLTDVKKTDLILVTGGNGFIGSHVAMHLHKAGYKIRIADLVSSSSFSEQICSEMLQGNLCDVEFAKLAVAGVHTVLHFAANMGGMGTIHSDNEFTIYSENHLMTLNVLSSAMAAGVKKLFYASSACVYPESLQEIGNNDVSLKEYAAWSQHPPSPQGLYGLEKLHSETLLHQFENHIQIKIARFHNIFGPRGAWNNGREKAPAALLRKAYAAAYLSSPLIEIWGRGLQRRSFLFIDDCIEAIIKLLNTDCSKPVNIGSTSSITINGLASIAAQRAGIERDKLQFQYVNAPKLAGVGSRNSNNDFVSETLGWEPKISLEEGMERTGVWIEGEMKGIIAKLEDDQRILALATLQKSIVINLSSDSIRFGILLPITSKGLETPKDCLRHLKAFAKSLYRTTWRNTHEFGATPFRITVYLSIDHDDEFLLGSNGAQRILQENWIIDIVLLKAHHPKGAVCSHWRDCARRAWEDGCTYMTLMGDDVVLQDEGWMEDVHSEFLRLAAHANVSPGFGCVAFTDTSFLGMPTFPVIHRTHLEIFSGTVVPEVFVNQDGDPFLFQLYRRWGCSSMIKARISNKLGGSEKARYVKQPAIGWTFDTLDSATSHVDKWLRKKSPSAQRKLTLDIIIPSYRVDLSYLEKILSLRPSPTCSTMFIIVIDNPKSPSIRTLEQRYAYRPDIRIRVNKENIGASASRNRGLQESSAEWVHFLDDDITPEHDLLLEAEKIIREHPNAAGFVGNSQFPCADTIFTSAVHVAGVTFFWDIATKMIEDDLPWGVTANLIARRNVKDGIWYDLAFPKTGGGEDIDYCRRKRDFSVNNKGEGFWPAPKVTVTHPWWYGGKRTYWRFFGWSKGDGALVKMYPDFRYLDAAPNSAELLLGCAIILAISVLGAPFLGIRKSIFLFLLGVKAMISVLSANIIHDLYRHLWRDAERLKGLKSSVSGLRWVMAVIESTLIRMASEAGRMLGMLERREIWFLGSRFDWFTNRAGTGPRQEERMNSSQRAQLFVLIFIVFYATSN